MRNPKTALAATLTLVALLLATPTPATAGPGDGFFDFSAGIDTNGDGTQDSRLGVHYQRNLDTHTLDAHAGWVDGDRRGYTCAFTFLTYRDTIVARATLSAFRNPADPKNGGYVKISDKWMVERSRNLDGTVNTSGTQSKECGPAVENYEPLVGDPTTPVVTFQHGPHTIDVRDFLDELDVTGDPDVVWDLASATDTQVVAIAYANGGELPILTLYYELIPDVAKGVAVGENTPGTMHPVTMHTGCGLDCWVAPEPDAPHDCH